MDNNGKDTKHTSHITRKMHLVRKDEEFNPQNKVLFEVGIQLVNIVTKNIS